MAEYRVGYVPRGFAVTYVGGELPSSWRGGKQIVSAKALNLTLTDS